MFFAELGARLDDWLHVQRLRWIRFKRWCGWRPRTDALVDGYARMWAESVVQDAQFVAETRQWFHAGIEAEPLNRGKTVTWRKWEPLSPTTSDPT